MSEMPFTSIKTQFVKDRILETSWKDRDYIYCLIRLERYIARGGAKSFAEGMALWNYTDKCPLEYDCIKKEMRDGLYASPEEFRELVAGRKREKAAEARREEQRRRIEEQRRRAEEDEERRQWLELGGRP